MQTTSDTSDTQQLDRLRQPMAQVGTFGHRVEEVVCRAYSDSQGEIRQQLLGVLKGNGWEDICKATAGLPSALGSDERDGHVNEELVGMLLVELMTALDPEYKVRASMSKRCHHNRCGAGYS